MKDLALYRLYRWSNISLCSLHAGPSFCTSPWDMMSNRMSFTWSTVSVVPWSCASSLLPNLLSLFLFLSHPVLFINNHLAYIYFGKIIYSWITHNKKSIKGPRQHFKQVWQGFTCTTCILWQTRQRIAVSDNWWHQMPTICLMWDAIKIWSKGKEGKKKIWKHLDKQPFFLLFTSNKSFYLTSNKILSILEEKTREGGHLLSEFCVIVNHPTLGH